MSSTYSLSYLFNRVFDHWSQKKVLLVFLAHEKNPKNQLHCQFNNCPKTEKKWLFAHENSRQKVMWDQFLILPFDTKSHDKKNHTQNHCEALQQSVSFVHFSTT